MTTWKKLIARTLLTGTLVGIAFWLGAASRHEPVAAAGVRKTEKPAGFQSGSERSLPILQEIAVTLKRIDARLAKFEKMALQPPRP
jgi:hypothetical protein